MRRRVFFGVGSLVLLVLIGLVGVPYLIPETPGLTLENFQRLYVGKSEERALAILGAPTRTSLDTRGNEYAWLIGKDFIWLRAVNQELSQGFMVTCDGRCPSLNEDPPGFWNEVRRLLIRL